MIADAFEMEVCNKLAQMKFDVQCMPDFQTQAMCEILMSGKYRQVEEGIQMTGHKYSVLKNLSDGSQLRMAITVIREVPPEADAVFGRLGN